MDPIHLGLMLGLGSAVTLAFANASIKASGDILMSRAALSGSAALMVLPFAFFVPLPNATTWKWLTISIPVHWLYQATLVRAMTRGDLSLVFPIMRGSAPLITAILAFVWLKETLTPIATFGLFIASAATIIFALPETGIVTDSRTRRAALFWAILTGGGVALYNVVDANGVRAAPTVPTFVVWLFLLDSIGINIACLWTRRTGWVEGMRLKWRYGVAAGALSIVSFTMALWGFRIAPVAHISALRETSVVFAALIGVIILKEGFGLRRLFAALALVTGLILMRLG